MKSERRKCVLYFQFIFHICSTVLTVFKNNSCTSARKIIYCINVIYRLCQKAAIPGLKYDPVQCFNIARPEVSNT